MRPVGQALAYVLFMGLVGFLSVKPDLRLLDRDEAVISISFAHAGQRVGECRRLTQEELNALPPNMRKPDECPRERHPVRVELVSNGTVLYSDTLPPSGLWSDGKSVAYRRIRVGAGFNGIRVRMDDTGNASGFNYSAEIDTDLAPSRNLVIGFDELSKTFFFK